MKPFVTKTEDWHVHYVAANMRQADIDEIWAQSMARPLKGLQFGVKMSTSCWTIMRDENEPVSIFGVGAISMIGGRGAPWLLSTDNVLKLSIPFLKGCKDYVNLMLDQFPKLENMIDARNKVSIRWLKWMGFDILDAKPSGPFQVPFHTFKMERELCVYH